MANKRASRNAGKGGTFAKGADMRRNTRGQTKKKTVELSLLLKNYLTDEGIKESKGTIDGEVVKMKNAKWLAKVIWREAIKGEFQFVQYLGDRIMGKPKENEGQPQRFIVLYADGNGGST